MWLWPSIPRTAAIFGQRARRSSPIKPHCSLRSASPVTVNATSDAEQALALGREIGDAGLVIRALIALCAISANRGDVASPYFAEAAELARSEGDSWRLSQTLSRQVLAAMIVGDPIGAALAAEEGREVANAIGDRFDARHYRWIIGCHSDISAAIWPGQPRKSAR